MKRQDPFRFNGLLFVRQTPKSNSRPKEQLKRLRQSLDIDLEEVYPPPLIKQLQRLWFTKFQPLKVQWMWVQFNAALLAWLKVTCAVPHELLWPQEPEFDSVFKIVTLWWTHTAASIWFEIWGSWIRAKKHQRFL